MCLRPAVRLQHGCTGCSRPSCSHYCTQLPEPVLGPRLPRTQRSCSTDAWMLAILHGHVHPGICSPAPLLFLPHAALRAALADGWHLTIDPPLSPPRGTPAARRRRPQVFLYNKKRSGMVIGQRIHPPSPGRAPCLLPLARSEAPECFLNHASRGSRPRRCRDPRPRD